MKSLKSPTDAFSITDHITFALGNTRLGSSNKLHPDPCCILAIRDLIIAINVVPALLKLHESQTLIKHVTWLILQQRLVLLFKDISTGNHGQSQKFLGLLFSLGKWNPLLM